MSRFLRSVSATAAVLTAALSMSGDALAGKKTPLQTEAIPMVLPSPCEIIGRAVRSTRATMSGDHWEGLDWPNIHAASVVARVAVSKGDCDEAKVHEAIKRNRNEVTEVRLKDLHQATYRNPVQAISNTVLNGFVGPKREDVPPVPLTTPFTWERREFDRNWRFNLNAWKMVEPMMLHHDKTGDQLAGRLAYDLIADWTRFSLVEGQPNEFNWYDIAAGQRAMKLAYMIDRAYQGKLNLSDDERALLLAVGHLHVERLLDPSFINPGNHGTFQIHGLAALCRTVPSYRLCQNADGYIAEQMEALVRGQFGAEAVHMEHSAEYHFFMHKVFDRLFSTGWYDDLEVTKSLLERVIDNKKWLIFPDGQVVRHGDTDQREEPLPADLIATSPKACISPTSYDPDCFILKTFPETGYATVRSMWNTDASVASMLFMMGSYHSHAHKQPDHLSIELFERGMPIIVDAGKFAYDETNPRRAYMKSTRAHNTVEIDGSDYARSKREAVGSMMESASVEPWG